MPGSTREWDDWEVFDGQRLGAPSAPGSWDLTERPGFDRLLAEVDALRKVSTLQERLFERALGGGDVRSLVDAVSRLIDRPVTALGPVFGTRDIDQSDRETVSGPIDLVPGVAVPIVLEGATVGQLIAHPTAEASDPTDRLILEAAARIIAMMLHRNRAGADATRHARQVLLVDLLQGTIRSESDFLARGSALGCDLSRPASLLVIEAHDAQSTEDLSQGRLARTVSFALTGLPALVATLHGRVVVLVPDGVQGRSKQLRSGTTVERATSETIYSALAQSSSSHPPVVALASGFSTLADGPRLYGEAVEAIRVARRLGRIDRVIQVDDRELRAYQILAGDRNENRSRAFVDDVLGKLATYDARHQGSLVATLEAYLDHNGNLGATAQALFIHLSTLKYRLTRIAEIGALSFHDPQDRFHAQLALRLRRILPEDTFVQTR